MIDQHIPYKHLKNCNKLVLIVEALITRRNMGIIEH